MEGLHREIAMNPHPDGTHAGEHCKEVSKKNAEKMSGFHIARKAQETTSDDLYGRHFLIHQSTVQRFLQRWFSGKNPRSSEQREKLFASRNSLGVVAVLTARLASYRSLRTKKKQTLCL